MERGLLLRVRAAFSGEVLQTERGPPELRELCGELLEALKEECGGGTASVMVSRFAMVPPTCEARYDEPGTMDGLALAVFLPLTLARTCSRSPSSHQLKLMLFRSQILFPLP